MRDSKRTLVRALVGKKCFVSQRERVRCFAIFLFSTAIPSELQPLYKFRGACFLGLFLFFLCFVSSSLSLSFFSLGFLCCVQLHVYIYIYSSLFLHFALFSRFSRCRLRPTVTVAPVHNNQRPTEIEFCSCLSILEI